MNRIDNMKKTDISIFTEQAISFGMSYVPWQPWEEPYDLDVGYMRGTIFPCLDKPFLGKEGVNNVR